MIRFVILDDNPLHRNKTKRMVNMYMFKTSYEYDIIEFVRTRVDKGWIADGRITIQACDKRC